MYGEEWQILTPIMNWTIGDQKKIKPMYAVDFFFSLRLTVKKLATVAMQRLNLGLHQCAAWNQHFRKSYFESYTYPICLYIPNHTHKLDSCHVRYPDTLYQVGQLGMMEVSCQCDLFCPYLGDCCADFESLPQPSPPLSPLYPPSNLVTGEFMGCVSNQIPPWNRTNPLGFWMIQDCPAENELMRTHCRITGIAEAALTFYHFVPVQHEGLVYRNIFCAWCHGAIVDFSHLWPVKFNPDVNKNYQCRQVIDRVLELESIPLQQILDVCQSGFSGPNEMRDEEVTIKHGETRMGKVCLLTGKPGYLVDSSMEEETQSDTWFAEKYRHCKAAIRRASAAISDGFNFFMARQMHNFQVITNLTGLCEQCTGPMESLFTVDEELLDRDMLGIQGQDMDYRITAFFDGSRAINCSVVGLAGCDDDNVTSTVRVTRP